MRRIFHSLSIALLCGILSIPIASAQGRSRDNRNGSRTERMSGSRGGNNSNRHGGNSSHNTRPNPSNTTNRRPSIGSNNNNRPGNNGGRPNIGNGGNNHRPGHGGRPGIGNNGNNNHRPGHDGRPGIGNNGNNNHRPGHDGDRPNIGNNNHRPGHGGMRPGHHGGPRPPHVAPPHRPYRPMMGRPHYRPMPPRGWRPMGRIPVIRGILGLTFGTAINLSLDYLFSSGYNVDGYTNDMVYLRNVSAMNYVWTDAALYYGANGLDASSFYYSTPRYDLMRYNNVYNSLVATYGMPVSINNAPGRMGATWFGGNNGYITLSFGSNNINGGLRYLTTLTFGL